MPSLDPTLRKSLENKIPTVRQIAEEASRAILNTLAVNRPEPFPGMSVEQRRLRNALRAKARQLGEGSQTAGFEPLVEELAYQQWHRMVFARFLAENRLLMHPSGVPVTLQECGELVQEEGEVDAWAVAAKYSTLMLPGIFRPNDPESQVRLTPEGQFKLESALNSIDTLTFLADDALGWMYQFWQKLKKDEINKSERKIGGLDLSPVTQLFTEDYMVSFLLENSLGAWWAARHPQSPLIKDWKYLRFKEDGSPAAGTFPGWPERAALVTMMDPCFGSGHILVAGFHMLSAMRMEEEGLSAADAGDAVLCDNLFGLELDPRCTQIGAFALALTAWKSGGYRLLPVPNIACTGIPVQGQLETWLKLAGDDSRLRYGLERLYNLFKNAPDLGSLINPADLPAGDRMFVADYEQVSPVLERAILHGPKTDDPIVDIFGSAMTGVVSASRFLAGKYSLVITNVPYLGLKKQNDVLSKFCSDYYPESKSSLATVFIERCRSFAAPNCTFALVAPLDWRSLSSYKSLRKKLLQEQQWNLMVNLGTKSFQTPMWDLNIGLWMFTNMLPKERNTIPGIDVSRNKKYLDKIEGLKDGVLHFTSQANQMKNPEYRISFEEISQVSTLGHYVLAPQGIKTGDDEKWRRFFWEIASIANGWEFYQSTVSKNQLYGGREHIIDWSTYGKGMVRPRTDCVSLGKQGVAISQMGDICVTLYTGERFDSNVAPIVPIDTKDLKAIWYFCQSSEFKQALRKIDSGLKINNGTLIDIPIDMAYWRNLAENESPIQKPNSLDPSQWLFNGCPNKSEYPLEVAVSRLLDYSWPQQEKDKLDSLADDDGIVCLVPTAGERPLAERLREVLASAYGDEWSPKLQAELLSLEGAAGKSLEDWLRDDFFVSHCRLFQNRPFLWHIWDGRKDGFSALVNYHKLNAARLDKLIFTYLGDWIRFQRARRDHGEPGADGRLVAALELEKKLKLIKEGEPPYDIYVRWKSLAQQPIGWDPDLNDGVRLNIRPFVTAGVLRSKFTINWNKDRGANPDGSERLNDLHFSIAEKQAARKGNV